MEGGTSAEPPNDSAVDEEPESDGDRAVRRCAYAIAARHRRRRAGKRRRKDTVGMWLAPAMSATSRCCANGVLAATTPFVTTVRYRGLIRRWLRPDVYRAIVDGSPAVPILHFPWVIASTHVNQERSIRR